MPKPFRMTVLVALFAIAPVSIAQQDAPPVEQAEGADKLDYHTTPADLAKLLEGLPAKGVVYTSYSKTSIQGSPQLKRETIEIDNKQLVCTHHISASDAEEKTYGFTDHVERFNLDGTFTGSSYITGKDPADPEESSFVELANGKVRVTGWRKLPGDRTEQMDKTHNVGEIAEDAIPSAWEPLALRYHLTRSHERFSVRIGSPFARMDVSALYAWQKTGTQEMQFNGKPTTVHIYTRQMEVKEQPDPRRTLRGMDATYWLTDQGEVVKYEKGTERRAQVGEAIPAEQAEAWIARVKVNATLREAE